MSVFVYVCVKPSLQANTVATTHSCCMHTRQTPTISNLHTASCKRTSDYSYRQIYHTQIDTHKQCVPSADAFCWVELKHLAQQLGSVLGDLLYRESRDTARHSTTRHDTAQGTTTKTSSQAHERSTTCEVVQSWNGTGRTPDRLQTPSGYQHIVRGLDGCRAVLNPERLQQHSQRRFQQHQRRCSPKSACRSFQTPCVPSPPCRPAA